MLESFRASRRVRLSLLLAAALLASSSLGLHPEPFTGAGITPSDGRAIFEPTGSDRVSHACLACLAHASVSLARGAAVPFAPAPIEHLGAAADTRRPKTSEFPNFEGRAPPAVS